MIRTVSGNNSVVECNLAKVEVAGSNPVSRSIRKYLLRGVSSPPPHDRRGRGLKRGPLHKKMGVAGREIPSANYRIVRGLRHSPLAINGGIAKW